MLRKIGIIAVLSLIIAALAAVPALAASPHFQAKDTSVSGSNANGNLTVSFRIAGLGNDLDSVKITLSSNKANAVYACQNNGGNFPRDPKKQTVSSELSVSDTFPVKNGSAKGSLTLTPPDSTLNCPGGQHAVLARITYNNVTLSAPGDSVNLGDFQRTFFPQVV
jgi:hypothetical protein